MSDEIYKPKPFALVVPTYKDLGIDGPYFGDLVWEHMDPNAQKYFEFAHAPIVEFSDKSEKVDDINASVAHKIVYIIHAPYTRPSRHYMIGSQLIDAVRRAEADKIVIFDTYNSYFRQDRRGMLEREPVTARIVIEGYENAGCNGIYTLHAHFKQIEGFGKSVINIPLVGELAEYIKESYKNIDPSDFIVSPVDEGGQKDAERFAECLGTDCLTAKKQRIGLDKTTGFRIYGDAELKPYIFIPDDIIGTGNSVRGTARALKELYAKKGKEIKRITLVSTHLGFYKGIDFLDEDDLYVIGTNTIPKRWDNPRIKVMDVSPIVAKAITRRVTGQSLRETIGKKLPK